MSTDPAQPAGWKTYDEFADGIATNRLPRSDALVKRPIGITLPGRQLALQFTTPDRMRWHDSLHGEGEDSGEAIKLAPDTFFIDLAFAQRPLATLTLIVNRRSGRALAIDCEVRSREAAGAEPRVAQRFTVGTLDGVMPSGPVPHETRELIGLRTWQTYSPNHVYEHTYLSSQRYAWQCLVGVQRGHGDVDMASYYKFDDEQYLFTFREFLIPVASVFFFDFRSGRSTGKFLGLTGSGEVANSPAGAFMRKASLTTYPAGQEPI